MKPRLTGMTIGLVVSIAAAVVAATAGGAYFYAAHHFQALIESARRSALAQGELIREALEHQMMEDDRSLIGRMVESFGRQPGVGRVVLLDRTGIVRYASAASAAPGDLDPASPTCQACHRLPPAERTSSRVIDTSSGALLRTMIPFRNREACHQCHDPRHQINGVMVLDLDTAPMQAAMRAEVGWMAAGSGLLAVGLVGFIGLIVRVGVLRRLQRFETAAREIAAGNLERRVPACGSDTIAWLAHEFNAMADSMTGLLSEVRDQRERLETVINSIDDGIVVLDTRRQVVAANTAFIRRTQRSRAHVLGGSCTSGETMCGGSDCPTLACLSTRERQVRICERPAAGDGTSWEEVHASPIVSGDGRITHVVEVWRDISERRAAEARLSESHRLASLGVLASGFSHELNTPLGTVLMCVEGILREAQGEGAASHIVENASIAREQILRCRGVTQHFLRISRGQSSATELVDVATSLEAAARLVEPSARAHAVHLDVQTPPVRLCVRADEAELQHVLVNLLLNAIQASAAGGRISARVVEGEPVCLRVTDSGCGIAPAHQARIFEPFFTLRKGGTGLGLYLSRDFVRRWGGDIRVSSTPGRGSTFEVVLPPATAIADDRRAS